MTNDAIESMKSNGFTPPSYYFDGKVHRFARGGKKNKSCWYVGFQNISAKNGNTYVHVTYGDFATGEKHHYKPGKMSREDHAVIKKQMADAAKAQEIERELNRKAACEKAEALLACGVDPVGSGYVSKKQITPYGAMMLDVEKTLLVPMRDVNGKLWGCQKIAEDGEKKFLFGQRIKGTMHLIGDVDDKIYLAEGFATACTIYEATKTATVAAFNANNLKEVAVELRRAHPQAEIIICADNDQFTIVNGVPKNVGVDAAKEAAEAALARVIVPEFDSVESKPTDFNDLQILGGLAAVKEQILGKPPATEQVGYIPLGYDDSGYVFFDKVSNDIVRIGSWTKPNLFQLAPVDYWNALYPGANGKGFNLDQAASDLIAISRKIGVFKPRRVRGVGVWSDDKGTVINTGSKLILNGSDQSMGATTGGYHIYVQSPFRIMDLAEPLDDASCVMLAKTCEMLKWQSSVSGVYLAGWLALARVVGAMPYHPHIWITGVKGSGKSVIIDTIVRKGLGCRDSWLNVEGATTEAAIRQQMKSSSVPLVFDEIEGNNAAELARLQSVIATLRSSWSGTSGNIMKGSSGGTAQSFVLNFSACLSSVRVSLLSDTDQSRFTVLELLKSNDAAHYKQLLSLLGNITESFGERLFARSAKNIGVILANYDMLKPILAAAKNQRYADQHGPMLAAYATLFQQTPLTAEKAKTLVDKTMITASNANAEVEEPTELLNYLLTTKIRISDHTGAVMEQTLEQIIRDEKNIAYLKPYGLVYKDGYLSIRSHHTELRKLLAGTRWVDCYRKVIARIDGAKSADIRIGQEVRGGYIIPLNLPKEDDPI